MCNSCSQKKFKLQNKTTSRVCDICFKQLSGDDSSVYETIQSVDLPAGNIPISMLAETLAQKATLKFKEKQQRERMVKASSRAGVQSALEDMKKTEYERKSPQLSRHNYNNNNLIVGYNSFGSDDEDISEEYNSDYDEEK